MEKWAVRKRNYGKWIFSTLVILLTAILFSIWHYKKPETEYTVIQAIMKDLPDYQDNIESWGYQVSVLPEMTARPDKEGFMRYYWKSVGPVLVLADQDNGMYCFYHGFDQYLHEKTYIENRMLSPVSQYGNREYADVSKTVYLQLYKREINQAPIFENTADIDSPDRYDVSARVKITATSLENGDELSVYGGGFFETNYCSSHFEECRWWSGIDPASINSYADNHIKQEYSAEQLLKNYKQGLELQNRLMELYYEK